ncbi:MAG TPA: TIGR04053 family radical SAM/SPASM domain-containing protein [bacterium]|nr:TIGR04053 family radical SAM/SPASM domain-containing protein [bacterium]
MHTGHRAPIIRRPAIYVERRPFIVIWEVTRACDLACAHCRAQAAPLPHPDELTTEEARKLIDEIAAFAPPAPLFVLTGGDPMKRPDLLDLVAHAVHRRLPVALSPSATPLLSAAAVADIRAAGAVALSLSLDGASAGAHDAFRGFPGVFDRTLAAWSAARACGLKVQINTTVTRANLVDLPGIAQLVRARGAMTWSVFFLVPVGRGVALPQLSPDECEDVLHFLHDVGDALPVKTTEGHHYKRVILERAVLERRGIPLEDVVSLGPTYRSLRAALEPWPAAVAGRRSPMDVNAGRGFVFVSHTGTVHPSGFLPLVAGSVRRQSLGEIYRQSPLFRALRDPARLRGRCGECEFATVCGGSRSRAFAVSGDPLAEDPLCAYLPGTFPFPDDIAEVLNGAGPRPARAGAGGEP